ncbi:hypothetical protein JZ751_010676 [Albula glossodonta]|uniref:RING-type E3 ubiquitin transferase n=1 Tax=Albula glossodonta TaxID=121402 RepID=A0A8T2N1C9_9TELE|nr:hypothetical protein JZ751_010676 [Albula glossodonta]
MMAAPVNAQNPSKTWELSLYELHRTPQEAIMDGTEIAVSPRSLHSELMCPICLDMLKNTMTTKDRDEYEAHQDRVLERLSRLHNKQALSSSIEEGLKIQAQHRVRKPQQESDNTTFSGGEDNCDARSLLSHDSAPSLLPPLPGGGPPAEAGPGPSRSKRAKVSDESCPEGDRGSPTPHHHHLDGPGSEIELVFRPHPLLVNTQDYNQTRYVKTTANATVDHLSKYLALRIALEERQADRQTAGEAGDDGGGGGGAGGGTLNGSLTLELVNEKYWKISRPLELYYAPTKEQQQQQQP